MIGCLQPIVEIRTTASGTALTMQEWRLFPKVH